MSFWVGPSMLNSTHPQQLCCQVRDQQSLGSVLFSHGHIFLSIHTDTQHIPTGNNTCMHLYTLAYA